MVAAPRWLVRARTSGRMKGEYDGTKERCQQSSVIDMVPVSDVHYVHAVPLLVSSSWTSFIHGAKDHGAEADRGGQT